MTHVSPIATMRAQEDQLKLLQRTCARALALYIDLTEAACEILIQSHAAPLTASDRARLQKLRRQEVTVGRNYFRARVNLMTALSLDASAERVTLNAFSELTAASVRAYSYRTGERYA
jgi:hypothetical protein